MSIHLKQFFIEKNSLARQALIGMALRITVIIVIATGVSYWHMQSTLRESILQNLSNYVDLRGKAESEQFLLAERQTTMVRDEFLRRLRAMGDYDPKTEFDQVFVREADGLIRVRPEINDHRRHATAYLRHDVQLTPDLRRRFYIGWQLMDQWGPMLVNRFFSGFMNMPEQLSINFCPTADWGRSATRELDITIYETVWRSTIEKNPKRLTFWTTVYYDPGADAWMVSCVTPGDYNGRWVVTGGQDVEITDLIRRMTADPVEKGAWNFIVDPQANLIAHPKLTEQIAKAGGNLQTNQLGDAQLTAMVKAVLAKGNDDSHTIELPDMDVILGVSQINGPGWYFVTVYPRQLLTAQALSTAYIFLAAGFGILLLELAIMATILRRRIAVPIAHVVSATEQISLGDFSVRLEPQGNNELGLLAASVNRMAATVGEHYEALRLSEELLSLFIHNSPIYAFIKDVTPTESRVLQASDNYQQMIGISGRDMIGKTMAELFPAEFAAKITADDWAVVARGEVLRLDEDLNGRNYTTIKFPIIQGGRTLLAGYTIDITERKKAEENLIKSEAFIKNILESVGEGFIVIDPEYKIISANRAYCEMQKTPLENIIGRPCYEVSHRTNKPCFMDGEECAPKYTFKTGEPHLAIHTHYDNNDNPIYIETRSFPMKDAKGKVFAVIEILNNVTEKRMLENQLRHAQKMEAVGTLAGGIAHDFNNMLNVIIGYASLMQMNMSHDDPKMEQVKEILNAGDRAAHLTKGLLTFSRKQVMEIRRVNLNEIIDNFKKMLTRIIGEDIELKIIPSEQALTLKADIVQIDQVLMNLAVNARDSMAKGGLLTIETRPFRIDRSFIKMHGFGEPGMYALIIVSDTGAGMDDRTRERIFEPFFTTKEFGRGTGLGLSIAYGVVKQHNGYINCYSEPGKGTTFKIYLPLIKEEAEKVEMAEAELPKGGTETILIAEDDAGVRGLTKQILEGFGYTVIEAVDGIDAVNKFKENKDNVHLLLFDLIMPNKNGKDAYEDIKGIRHDIKVIFTSGYAADIIQRFGIEFISKPVFPNELLRKVRDMLDGRK